MTNYIEFLLKLIVHIESITLLSISVEVFNGIGYVVNEYEEIEFEKQVHNNMYDGIVLVQDPGMALQWETFHLQHDFVCVQCLIHELYQKGNWTTKRQKIIYIIYDVLSSEFNNVVINSSWSKDK